MTRGSPENRGGKQRGHAARLASERRRATLHAGCRHVSQGELDYADFAGARCLLPLRDALPDVTVLPC